MTLELHWTCDGCGRREISPAHELPKNWSTVRGRQIAHHCPDCALAKGRSSSSRQLYNWCLRNPALAIMTTTVSILLLCISLMSVFMASNYRRLLERTVQLERANRTLLDQKVAAPKP
jgi:hypothetical protein